MNKKTIFRIQMFILPLCLTLLSSCSNIGLLSNKSKYLPTEIESFGDFFQVFLILQLSILLIGLLVGIFLGNGASNIVTLLHLIWIVSYRDYGFLIVLGLFVFLQIIFMTVSAFIFPMILVFFRRNKN